MFLIPASRSPLRRILIGGKDMLLAYANGKSRVWNVETLEFRRSTGIDAADDMLRSDEWAEVSAHSWTSRPLLIIRHLVDVPVSAPISSAESHQARDSDLGESSTSFGKTGLQLRSTRRTRHTRFLVVAENDRCDLDLEPSCRYALATVFVPTIWLERGSR